MYNKRTIFLLKDKSVKTVKWKGTKVFSSLASQYIICTVYCSRRNIMFFLPPQYSDSSIFWGRLIKNDLYPFLLGTVYWGVGRSQKLLLSGQLDKSGRRRTANQSGISPKSVAGKYPINLFSFYEWTNQNITQGHSFKANFYLNPICPGLFELI